MSSASDNEDCSQETTSATDLVHLVEQMRADSKRRKEAKRKAIETEYAQKVDKIRAKAHAIHDAHKAKVAKSNHIHHTRLASLLHSRQIEEMAIWASLKRLEAARCALADLLVHMYSQRLEVMAEISTTGKLPSEVEEQEQMEREREGEMRK